MTTGVRSGTNVQAPPVEHGEMESVSARTNRGNAVQHSYVLMEVPPYKELLARRFYVRVPILTNERATTFALSILDQEMRD